MVAYQTGIYAQADLRKVPSLPSLLEQHEQRPPPPAAETFAQAMEKWKA